MSLYTGKKCPVCGNAFAENDDVVVCPVCGAAHHRECYKNLGRCFNEDNHDSGKMFEQETIKQEDARPFAKDAYAERRCPRCGAVNEKENKFCNICGAQISDNSDSASGGEKPDFQMPYNPYINPLGGTDPEEKVGDILVKDYASFVGTGAFYFVPRFKLIQRKLQAIFVNWFAFLFQSYYIAYRKMYALAAAVFVLTAITTIPTFMVVLSQYSAEMSIELPQYIENNLAFIEKLYYVLSTVSAGVRFVIGFSFDRLYKKHCDKKIKGIIGRSFSQRDYRPELVKKGGVSPLAVALTLLASLACSFITITVIMSL